MLSLHSGFWCLEASMEKNLFLTMRADARTIQVLRFLTSREQCSRGAFIRRLIWEEAARRFGDGGEGGEHVESRP